MKKAVVKKQAPIVFFDSNRILTDSLFIASEYGKKHKNVLRRIRKSIEKCKKFGVSGLIHEPSDYIDERGKTQEKYLLNQKAYLEVAVTFTGDRAFQLRVVFIEAFDRYSNFYKYQKLETGYDEARQEGKIDHRHKTDALVILRKKAIEQGSKGYAKNAELIYIHYANMANDALFNIREGLKNVRNHLNVTQLKDVAGADRLIDKLAYEHVQEMHYKKIYKEIKKKVFAYGEIIGRTEVPHFQLEFNQSKQLELF